MNAWRKWELDSFGLQANLTIRFPRNSHYHRIESNAFAQHPQRWTHLVKDTKSAGISFERMGLMSVVGDINIEVSYFLLSHFYKTAH